MLEKSISWLILLGTSQRYLQEAKAGRSIKGNGFVLDNIDRFLNRIDELGFTVTRRAAGKLINLKDQLEKADNAKLTEQQAKRLGKIMSELRPTLVAEAGGTLTYIVSERRFPIERLVDDISGLFARDVFESLPEIAQHDFSESGKCLAFERSTAAAFHMLRGTEAVLKHYYCQKVKKKRSDLMWGAMIQSMKAMPKRFPEVIINQVDHIRSGFRNPTAHPEKLYDVDEAQDLLSICVDATNRMVQDLK